MRIWRYGMSGCLAAAMIGAAALSATTAGAQSVETVETERVTAEVLSVDRAAGKIQLRNTESGEEWVHAPPGGLSGILGLEAGDRVTALTTRGVTAYGASRGDDPGPTVDGFTTKATREGRPAMVVGRLTTQVFELVSWNTETDVVTVRAGDGTQYEEEVTSPEGRDFLDKHEPGRRIVVEISETVVLISDG